MQRGLGRASFVLLVIIMLSLWALPGCAEENVLQESARAEVQEVSGSKARAVTVFYQTEEGYLVPYNTLVPDDENVARHIVEKLIAGPPEKEFLKGTLPEGVIVRGLYVKNESAFLDLGGVKEKEGAAWHQAVESIVLSLTELPDVTTVQILLDGKEIDKPLRRPGIINPISGGPPDGRPSRLYFSYHDVYLVPVTVNLPPETEEIVSATINWLISGPQGIPGLSPVFPEGTRLLGLKREGDLVYLNFSKEAVLGDKKNNFSEQKITLAALAYTLRQFPGIKRFAVLVDGEPYAIPGLKQPITVPETYRDWFGVASSRGLLRLLTISG
ncbi:MAG: germination protein [Bacillota bacterium]|nr:germination protein [Bacillota bacterium]